MNKTLQQHFYSKENKFNTLFLPGVPGEFRDRPLISDLKKLGSNLYSVVYPGTYGTKGVFSIESTKHALSDAIDHLNITKLPLLIIGYSFSTLFIFKSLEKVKKPMGVILFSPIMDLEKSINSDFKKEFASFESSQDFEIDKKSFGQWMTNYGDYKKRYRDMLDELSQFSAPVIFAIGEKDLVIKTKEIREFLDQYRENEGLNKFSVVSILEGGHRLDSLYMSGEIKRLIVGIVFAHRVALLFPEVSVFTWGATLNYRYANQYTDVDLVIIGKSFSLSNYISLNRLVNQFKTEHGIEVDIVVNTFDELLSKNRIRSNRGPSFIHELKYYYLPLRVGRKFSVIKISKKDIQNDGKFANSLNIYKSKKALLNYPADSPANHWILKNFIIACYYDQYHKGNMYIDQNNIEEYYKNNPTIHKLLVDIRNYKKNNYRDINLKFLKKVVIAHEQITQ